MEKKFTQGKWKYEVQKNRINVIIPTSPVTILTFGRISSDDCGNSECCKVEEHANARLAVAAPVMLNALEKAKEFLDFIKDQNLNLWSDKMQLMHEASASVDNAIKKATEKKSQP